LEGSEVDPYVQHRFGIAELSGDSSFDDDVFPAISAYTHGIPRHLNLLCSRLRLRSYLTETHAGVCEVAKEWLSEPGMSPTLSGTAVGKRTPKIERCSNVIERTLAGRESSRNRLVMDWKR